MTIPARQRFMYQNLLTVDNIDPSSTQTPLFRQIYKKNWLNAIPGGARGFISGNYTGIIDLGWIVEVNDISAGASIGQAKFRYSTTGGQTWAASGLTTAEDPVLLEQGVSFFWDESRFGKDFAVGDRWYFKTLVPFSVRGMLDYQDRGYTFRSGGTPVTFTVDLGSAQAVQAFCILDHNLTEDAEVRLQGNSALSWGTSPVDETLLWNEGSMIKFLTSVSYRYWLITVDDPSNEAEYLEIGKMYLGRYMELPHRSAAHLPWQENIVKNSFMSQSTRGVQREEIDNRAHVFPLMWEFLPDTDEQMLEEMRDSVWNEATKNNRSLIFSPDHRELDAYMCWLDSFDPSERYPHKWRVEISLVEVSRK